MKNISWCPCLKVRVNFIPRRNYAAHFTVTRPGLDRVLTEHRPTADVPTPFPLVAGPQHSSVCDLASLQCASFPVLGQDFVAGPGLACSLRPVSVEDSSAMNWKYLDGPLRSPATFINETR